MLIGLVVALTMAAKLFFSCTFWFASFHKLNNLENFSAILADYGLGEWLPRKAIAAMIALVEFTLATLLVIPSFSAFALPGMAMMLAIYMLALLYVYRSGKKLRDCGCGTRPQPVTLWPAIRNSLLLVLIIMLALFPVGREVTYALYDWLVIVPVAAIFLLAYWTIEEMWANHLLLTTIRQSSG